MASASHHNTPSRRTPRLSRQSSSTSLNVGLPPPLPTSPSLDMTIASSASSRSLRTGSSGSPSKRSPRKTPRIRRGDVSSSATSDSDFDSGDMSEGTGIDGMLLVPHNMVKASPTVVLQGHEDRETTPRRKVAMPIEPMTVGRPKKRETLQERLAHAARLKKSQSHGDGFHPGGGHATISELGLGTPGGGVAKEKESEGASGKDKVVVCLRIKPTSSPFMQSAYELSPTSLALADKHPNVVKRGGKLGREAEYTYPVDLLLRQPAKTPELYCSKIAPLVQKAMNGFNSTIFAYGQTGSGKSFTMTGTSSELGVIPCAVDGVFDAITADTDRAFLLRVSYVEIYNEGLRDLLNFAEGKREVPVIHSGKGKVYVSPLVEEIVATPQDVMKLLARGNEGRKIGATDWNERSSRSHCVFTIVIESRPRDTSLKADGAGADDAEADEDIRLSRLNLIDLAGSEKAVSDVERRGEGKHINQSLLALREVINKLTEKKRSHIPYRNSKLTHLLENALGGDSNICVICTMSAEEEHVAETLETLKFAGRCSQVETKAVKNVLPSSEKALIRAKDAEIEELKKRLQGLAGGSAGAAGGEKDDQVVELAESVADLEERKKRLTIQLAKLNGEILTSELPRLNGMVPMSPAKPKRRRISEFLGHDRPKTPASSRRAVSGRPVPIPLDTTVQPKDLFSDRTTSALRAALSTKDAEIASLRAALLEAQTSASSTNTTLLDSAHQLEVTRSELAANIEDKQSKIDTLESAILELRKSREDILIEDQSRLDAVQRKLDMANAELQRVQRVATGDMPGDLEREQEAFRQDLKQMGDSHDVEVRRLKGEMGRLRDQLKERWGVAETAVMQRKETQMINVKWEKEVERSREAVARYDALLARSKELEEGAKKHKDVQRHVEFLEASNSALQSELARVEAEAREHLPRISELEALVDELRAERMDAMARVADMEFDLVSLKEESEAKGKEVNRTKEELERRTEQLAQRDVECELARSKLGKEVEGLKGENARLVEEMERAKGELRRDTDDVRAALQEAQNRAQVLEEQIGTHVADLEVAQRDHDETKQQLEAALATHATLTAELADTKDRHATTRTELEQARSLAGGNDEMLQRLRADIDIAQNKANELKGAKGELEAEVMMLKEQLQAGDKAKEELKDAIEHLERTQADKARLEVEVSSAIATTSERDAAVARLKDELDVAEQSKRELASKVEDVQARLEKAESTVRDVSEQLEAERLVVQTKVRELVALRSTVDGASADSMARIAQLEADLKQASISLEDERTAVAASTKELDGLRASHSEAAKMQAERITELESAHSTAQTQLDATQKERDELCASYTSLETRAAELQTTINGLHAMTAEDDGRLVQLRTDIDDLTRQLESRTIEVNDLMVRIEEEQKAKQAALEGAARAVAERGEAEVKLQLSREQEEKKLRVLQVELDEARSAIQLGKNEVADLSKQLKEATLRETQAMEKAEKAGEMKSALRKEYEQAVVERDDLQKRVAAMEAEAANGARESKETADKLKILQTELDSARAAAEAAQTREVAAKAALDTANNHRQTVQTELAAARKKMAGLEETIMASEQDDKAARDRLTAAKKDIIRLESERDQARTALGRAEYERAEAVKQSEELSKTKTFSSAQLAKAQSELSAAKAKLANAEMAACESIKKVNALEKELQQVRDAAAAAAKSTLKRRTSNGGTQHTLPTIHADELEKSASAENAVRALQNKHVAEIGHLEAVIDEQEKTINVQREKIVFWSNELEKQQEVIRLLTATPESPGRTTTGPGTRHVKSHSIADSPSRLIGAKSGSAGSTRGTGQEKENVGPPATTTGAGGEASKKPLTGTFTARNLALPSAPTPLPMHTGQYSNTAARKMRRVTIDHDMEALNESSKIAQARAIFDTPDKTTMKGTALGNTQKQRRP